MQQGQGRRRQVHLWLEEEDYAYLSEMASRGREPLSAYVRRLVRSLRARTNAASDARPPRTEDIAMAGYRRRAIGSTS
jgi:hypothetical protein